MNVGYYCPSAGRPANVPRMLQFFGPGLIFITPEDEVPDYRAYGASQFLPVPEPNLPAQRNIALEHAFNLGRACVQTDDDLNYLKTRTKEGQNVNATPQEFIEDWLKLSETCAAQLYGPGTTNPYFSRHKVKSDAFIIGWFFMVLPSTPRFDVRLQAGCGEDYDFSCQHVHAYGEVARCEWQSASYKTQENRGGCQTQRTRQKELAANAVLLERWPHYVRVHPKWNHDLQMRPRREWRD